MTDQQRAFWHVNRIVGPILVFGLLFFVLYKFTSIGLEVSGAIAGFVAVSDYFALTWLMGRMDKQ